MPFIRMEALSGSRLRDFKVESCPEQVFATATRMKNADWLDVFARCRLQRYSARGELRTKATNQRPELYLHIQDRIRMTAMGSRV